MHMYLMDFFFFFRPNTHFHFFFFFPSLSPTPTPEKYQEKKMSGFLTNPETRKILKAAIPVTVGLASLAYLAVKLASSKTSNEFTSDKVLIQCL